MSNSNTMWLGKTGGWLLMLGTIAVMPGAPALAADWSMELGASEFLTYDDNLGLDDANQDGGLILSSSFNLDLLAVAETYRIEFLPALSVQRTLFSDEADNWDYFPSAMLAMSKSTKLSTYDITASFSRKDASSNELIDDVVVNDEGKQLNYAVTGAITHKISERDSLIWSNSASMVDYTEPSDDLVPYYTLSTSGTWQRNFSELVVGTVVVGAQYYDPDSSLEHDRMVYRSTAGIKARLTKRLSVSGAAGTAILDADEEETSIDAILNIGADYKLKDTTYSFSAARDLSPSQDGELLDSYSAKFGLTHQFNDMLAAAVTGAVALQSGSDDEESSAVTISPSLTYQLTENWKSALSYRYIHVDDEDGSANSNAVTFSLSYGRLILP